MLVIRLRRTGKKKKPSFRVVVAEKTMPIYGRFVDIIGNVNLQVQPKVININKEKALEWMKKGAKPSGTVARLMVKTGILKEEDIEKKPDKKRLKKKEMKSRPESGSASLREPEGSSEPRTAGGKELKAKKPEGVAPAANAKTAEDSQKPQKEEDTSAKDASAETAKGTAEPAKDAIAKESIEETKKEEAVTETEAQEEPKTEKSEEKPQEENPEK